MARENAFNSSRLGLRGQDCIYQKDACGCQTFSYLCPICTQRGLCVQHGHCLYISPAIKLLTAWDMKHLPEFGGVGGGDWWTDWSIILYVSFTIIRQNDAPYNIGGKVLQGGKQGEAGGSNQSAAIRRRVEGGKNKNWSLLFKRLAWSSGDEQLFHPQCSAASSNPSSPVTAPFIFCLLW